MNASPPLSISLPLVLREGNGGIAHLRLNRATGRNVLSLEMMAALGDALASIAADPAVRVMVLSGEGLAFCAGHDLKQLVARRGDADGGRAFFAHTLAQCSALMLAITRMPQPAIAAVEGIATAAGCQLVATCDLAVAGENARFCTPGVDIGLFCSTPMVALTRNIAPKHAMEMLLTGDAIPAAEAHRIGLVNRVVPAAGAVAAALSLAQKIASKPALTVKTGKALFHRQAHLELSQAYALAARVMTENLLAGDACEGIGAFLEKRAPVWPHGQGMDSTEMAVGARTAASARGAAAPADAEAGLSIDCNRLPRRPTAVPR